MGRINGHNTLTVIRTVEVGGGATLNFDYSLTPPEDTSKIWIKLENHPTNVRITNENRALIDNEVKTVVNLNQNIWYQSQTGAKTVKIGNYIYMSNVYGDSSGIGLSTYGSKRITKLDLTTGELSFEVGTGTSRNYYLCGKKDNNTIYYITYYNSDSPRYKFYEYNLTTKESTYIYGNNSFRTENVQNDGNFIFGFSQDGTTLHVQRLNVISLLEDTFDITLPYSRSNSNQIVVKNGKIYIPIGRRISQIDISSYYHYYTDRTDVYCYDIETQTIVDTGKHFSKSFSGGSGSNYWTASARADGGFMAVINGDIRMYGGNDQYYYNGNAGGGSYGYGTNYWISGAIGCVDEEENKIYIIGGLTYGQASWNYNATSSKIQSYSRYDLTWTLIENNLLLSTYRGAGIHLPVISDEATIIECDLSFAYIGDSNNVAQPVDVLYYDNNLWKGVNCLGWTQLENATIGVSDKTIVVGSYNNQTIHLDLQWANESGQYSVSVASSDETIATTQLLYSSELGYGLRINGIDVGNATITISVVDDYGTTFVKTITATIEAQQEETLS